MSRAEREFTKESIEDHQADEFVAEHLGVPPGEGRGEDEPSPD